MLWNAKNLSGYLKAPDYMDSVIIPLVPLDFGQDMMPAAREWEYIEKISAELERQLTGRLIKSPSFTYLKNDTEETTINHLLKWQQMFVDNGIIQCFFITSDVMWKEKEKLLNTLIWQPALPMEHLSQEQQGIMIDESVQVIIKQIQLHWAKKE